MLPVRWGQNDYCKAPLSILEKVLYKCTALLLLLKKKRKYAMTKLVLLLTISEYLTPYLS